MRQKLRKKGDEEEAKRCVLLSAHTMTSSSLLPFVSSNGQLIFNGIARNIHVTASCGAHGNNEVARHAEISQ